MFVPFTHVVAASDEQKEEYSCQQFYGILRTTISFIYQMFYDNEGCCLSQIDFNLGSINTCYDSEGNAPARKSMVQCCQKDVSAQNFDFWKARAQFFCVKKFLIFD